MGVRKLLPCLLALLLLLTGCVPDPEEDATNEKPVLYLYPTEETKVQVQLDLDGALTASYPAYGEGWQITASPDGTLTDENGRQYYCLFWEGDLRTAFDFSQGFCVAGEETAAFLEEALAAQGLTDKEAEEFIIYWLPRMEGNAYNRIAFQSGAYTAAARLTITPAPDSFLRLFMAWTPLTAPVEIEPQDLPAFRREGFAAVEWGGAEMRNVQS